MTPTAAAIEAKSRADTIIRTAPRRRSYGGAPETSAMGGLIIE
jgi:hypothetical protein